MSEPTHIILTGDLIDGPTMGPVDREFIIDTIVQQSRLLSEIRRLALPPPLPDPHHTRLRRNPDLNLLPPPPPQ